MEQVTKEPPSGEQTEPEEPTVVQELDDESTAKKDEPEVIVEPPEANPEAATTGEGESEEGEQEEEATEELSPEEQVVKLNDQLLRLAADFENYRKRSRREQEELRKYGIEQVVRAMLPVLDNLERALEHADDSDPILQGVKMVAKQFSDAIANYGVRSFSSLGEPFDPERHEAMGQAPSEEVPAGAVFQELEKGYTLHDRLLRPAKVLVAVAPQATPPAEVDDNDN